MTLERTIRHTEEVMGTVVTYLVDPGDCSERELTLALRASAEELHRLDELFSTWKPHSPMSRFRRGELEPSDVPVEIIQVLELCSAVKKTSEGWFDPWALEGGVDPTGLVKGWAIERATALLAHAGVGSALLNGGGDIASAGPHGRGPDGTDAQPGTATATTDCSWRIGIQHPWRSGGLACVVDLVAGSSVATSGRYERGEHLIDPFVASSSAPRRRVASATVTGPSLAVADGLATALAVAGEALWGSHPLQEGYESYRIYEDGVEEWTVGFPFAPASTKLVQP
ncbi:MAG: FAD:protein FMN transferase [Acidimicrobiales bacterium]